MKRSETSHGNMSGNIKWKLAESAPTTCRRQKRRRIKRRSMLFWTFSRFGQDPTTWWGRWIVVAVPFAAFPIMLGGCRNQGWGRARRTELEKQEKVRKGGRSCAVVDLERSVLRVGRPRWKWFLVSEVCRRNEYKFGWYTYLLFDTPPISLSSCSSSASATSHP